MLTDAQILPSRQRVVHLFSTLLHLLFRLVIVSLLGRLDGFSRPALRRKGALEHGDIRIDGRHRYPTHRLTGRRANPKAIRRNDTSWSKARKERTI